MNTPQQRYNRSEKGRAAQRRYRRSEKGKIARANREKPDDYAARIMREAEFFSQLPSVDNPESSFDES